MSEAGFTVAEALSALAVAALASAAVLAGGKTLARLQQNAMDRTTAMSDSRRMSLALEAAFDRGGPFSNSKPEAFAGDAGRATFFCGAGDQCELAIDAARHELTLEGRADRLVMSLPADARLSYQGRISDGDAWPPTAPGRDTLRAVTLIAGSGNSERVLFSAHLRREQPADCAYDPIAGDCR